MSLSVPALPLRAGATGALALLPVALLALGFLLFPPDVSRVADIAWLITVSEQVLDGQTLYVDLVETNPPASLWLYLPAVWLARHLHVVPEMVVNLQILALAGFSLWLGARLLDRAGLLARQHRAAIGCLAVALLVLLPNGTFGQREHAGVLLLLPVLAGLCLRLSRQRPARMESLACGIAAGFAICIKPHFAFAYAAAVLAAAAMKRDWRLPVCRENWIVAVVLAVYAASIVLFTPGYLSEIMPLVALDYLPVRMPWARLLREPALMLWATALLALAMAARGRRLPPPAVLLAAASLGGLLGYLAQGKGWPYHAVPMLLFALLAGFWALCDTAAEKTLPRAVAACTLAGLAVFTGVWFGQSLEIRALARAVAMLHPHPTMMSISGEIAVGHPLVRLTGGTWVGRECAQWNIFGGIQRKETESLDGATLARIDAAIAMETKLLAQEIDSDKPDIILVQIAVFDWGQWIAKNPAVAAAMAAYRDKGAYDGVRIMQRAE